MKRNTQALRHRNIRFHSVRRKFCDSNFTRFRITGPYEKHLRDHQMPTENKSIHPNIADTTDASTTVVEEESDIKVGMRDTADASDPDTDTVKEETEGGGSGKEKAARHRCKICDKDFANSSALSNHKKSHDVDSKSQRFLCDICKRVFNHPSNLRRHIKHVHTDDYASRKYACDKCGKKFKEASILKTHMELHNAVRTFPCKLCPKSYAKNSQLITHMRGHTGDKPYTCNLCGKAFKTLGNLKSHKLNRHVGVKLSKTHLCQECGQGYIKEYDLRKDLNSSCLMPLSHYLRFDKFFK